MSFIRQTHTGTARLAMKFRFSIVFGFFRRKHYMLYNQLEQNIAVYRSESSINSVQNVHIQSKESALKCRKYFPNATELVLKHDLSTTRSSFVSVLDRIVPLKQLTVLVIERDRFAFQNIIQILRFTPNVHTLKFQSTFRYEKNNDLASIKESEDFQSVSDTNVIRNISCDGTCTPEQIKLLVALFPRVQHLIIHGWIDDFRSILRSLLDKNNCNAHDLCSFHCSSVYSVSSEDVQKLIESEKLLDDYTLKKEMWHIYLWW